MVGSVKPYFERGGITLYHGDCRNLLPILGAGVVALVLADPPYGIKAETDHRSVKGKLYAPVLGDDEPFEPGPFLGFPKCVLFGAINFYERLSRGRGWIVWDKVTRDGINTPHMSDAELAWTNFLPHTRIFRHMWNGAFRDSERGFHVHPTQKPVAMMRWILEMATKPGDLVFDPYAGSGPVMRACYEMGRRYIGTELSEAYCELAANRLSQSVLDLDFAQPAPSAGGSR